MEQREWMSHLTLDEEDERMGVGEPVSHHSTNHVEMTRMRLEQHC